MNYFEGNTVSFAEAARLGKVNPSELDATGEHLVRELLAANRKSRERAEAESHRGRVKLAKLREEGLVD